MEFGRESCESVFRNPFCNASLAFADGQEARMVADRITKNIVTAVPFKFHVLLNAS